jgi:hypothetical protein
MIRLFTALFATIGLGVATYLLIRLHGTLIIRWKHVIEEYEESEGQMFNNDEKIKDMADLIGFTMIPVIAALLVFSGIYYLIKGIVY